MEPLDRALFDVVQRGDLEATARCLRRGANVNAVSPVGSPGAYTPLMLAALFGHLPSVRLLLKHGAYPSAETPGGSGMASRTVLSLALANGHVELVRTLLQYGAAVNARNDVGLTALALARLWQWRPQIRAEMLQIIELLEQAGAEE